MQTENAFRLQVYVDPLFGSERFLSFEAAWVEEVWEGSKWLIFRPRTPVTFIKFNNGETLVAHGHWAEQIRAAQKCVASDALE